jgi:ketosteroid isomerase-like protein
MRQQSEKLSSDMNQSFKTTVRTVTETTDVSSKRYVLANNRSMKTEQTNTSDPQLREQLDAKSKKFDEACDNKDAAAVAALFTEDAVLVNDTGPVYGRKAIEKSFADLFQKWSVSNHISKRDRYSPHIIGTAGNEAWINGEWSLTLQGQNDGPYHLKGYWSSVDVREGDACKDRMQIWNITPAPPAETK